MNNILQFKDLKKIINARAKELEFMKYINSFRKKTIVVKYGGSALETSQKIFYLINDIVFMKQQGIDVILIHGGSRQLNKILDDQNIENKTLDGIRITTKDVLKYAIAIFKAVNQLIVNEINKKGNGEVKAIGLNGSEVPISISTFLDEEKYGYVGKIDKVNVEYLNALRKEYIPVLSSLSQTENNQPLNINADMHAAEIAKEIKAEKLIIMTDKIGILNKEKELIPSIDCETIKQLINEGVISAGMTPKVEACMLALEGGVHKVHIIDGTVPHALVKEVFTDEGVGTEIVKLSNKIRATI